MVRTFFKKNAFFKKSALIFSLITFATMSSMTFALEPSTDASRDKVIFEAALKAAGEGNVEAMFQTAINYDFGYGVERDLTKAVEWYEKAASKNSPDAMFSLASIYEDGQLGAVNLPKAVEWYKKATDLGNVDAMFNLAIIYENGELGDKDYPGAFRLFSQAAEKGDVESMRAVAEYYRKGKGVAPNMKLAEEWAAKAKAAAKQSSDETAPESEKNKDEPTKAE